MVLVPVGQPPLSDARAAAAVTGPGWEPRPQNSSDNAREPDASQLRAFYAQNHNPYSRYVDSHFRGTTDQIIQWAAAKWGLSPDLLRAVAATETWWVMSFVGNDGTAFGLYQVRRPYHCTGATVCGLFRHDTAFNADYYGSIIPQLLRRHADVAEHRLGQRRAVPRRRAVELDRLLGIGPLGRAGGAALRRAGEGRHAPAGVVAAQLRRAVAFAR